MVDAEMAVIRQNVMTDHYNGQKEKIIKTLSEYHYCFGFMRLSLMVYMLGRIKETRHIIDKIVMIERRFSLPLQDQEKLN